MRRAGLLLPLALLAVGCDQDRQQEQPTNNRPVSTGLPPAAADQPGVTPMAQRVAVLGFLNKRNGIVRDLVLRPGQAVRIKDAVVRLRACEASAPWENQPLTGAFVQLDVQRPDEQWGRVFSGWLYKESPSLNVVEHPVYDVWPKSCAMAYPSGRAAPAAPQASSNRSSARRSGGAAARAAPAAPAQSPPAAAEPSPEPPPATPPIAADSNAT